MKEKIYSIIIDAIEEVNQLTDKKINLSSGLKTYLYGSKGIDSFSLVNLIVAIEERIETNFEKTIVLANEKAFSQKNSPFLTVESLVNFIELLLNEKQLS